ncbi:hypothetical protein HanPSC8_Chr17g0756991 [Helianthus annuus]|nr:hypothetical protein HanIR_Chr17g0856531 [Helianthus annuus]KAJ0811997.1 hypothetical protein HanPSC8_Chr17g0756991 [Helianthus annuus]
MILGLLGMHFGGKTSWVFSFHADPVLSNPNPCIRTLYHSLSIITRNPNNHMFPIRPSFIPIINCKNSSLNHHQ